MGVDGSLAVWNFRLSEAQRVVALAPAVTPARPLGVGWLGATVVAGDSSGAYCSAALSAEFLLPLCPPLASLEQEEATRTLLYTRDLPGAFAMVAQRVKSLTNGGEYDKALELLEVSHSGAVCSSRATDTAHHRLVVLPASTACQGRPAYGIVSVVIGVVGRSCLLSLRRSHRSMREDFTLLAAYLPPRLPVPPAGMDVVPANFVLLFLSSFRRFLCSQPSHSGRFASCD